jgi:hypothetical protein
MKPECSEPRQNRKNNPCAVCGAMGVRFNVGEKNRWSGLEFRNPTSEIRKKSETRNPNAAIEHFQLNLQSGLSNTA